jgi:hypothetical protein
VNQVFAARSNADGSFDSWKLTKSKYYIKSDMTNRTRKAKKWNEDVVEEHKLLAGVSPKAKSIEEFREYLAVVAKVYDRLWEFRLPKRWRRADLRVYGGRNRVFDRFFSGMARDIGPDATVHWGDATINPNMKGTKSAPTPAQLKRARLHLKKINLVDEYRTSKVCHCCDGQIHAVRRKEWIDGKKRDREVRGLRWCSTSHRFFDRDFNSAIMMIKCASGRTPNTTRDSETVAASGPQQTKWIVDDAPKKNKTHGARPARAGRHTASSSDL